MAVEKEVEILVGHSQESHNLWEWLVSDITNHKLGKKAGSPQEDVYHRNETRLDLKKAYIKALGYVPSKKPIENFHTFIDNIPNLTEEQKIDIKLKNIRCIQDTLCRDNNFSTALNLMSQEKMNKLIKYTIDVIMDYGIEIRKEIVDLFKQQDMKNYIYICLKYQKCCCCGVEGAEIHHVDHVTKIGGRKHDDGTKLRIMPLCRTCHTKAHSIGEKRFYIENEVEGILFSEEEIMKFMPHYKNQFEALREKIKNEYKI